MTIRMNDPLDTLKEAFELLEEVIEELSRLDDHPIEIGQLGLKYPEPMEDMTEEEISVPEALWASITISECSLGGKNLMIIPYKGMIEFTGESIPEYLKVLSCYTPPEGVWPKRGREWQVLVSPDKRIIPLQAPSYWHATSREGWIEEFKGVLRGWALSDMILSDERIIKALATIYPEQAVKINEVLARPGRTLQELLQEQDRIANAIHLDLPFIGIEG